MNTLHQGNKSTHHTAFQTWFHTSIYGLTALIIAFSPTQGYASTTDSNLNTTQTAESRQLQQEISSLESQLAEEKARAQNLRTNSTRVASQDANTGGINAMMESLNANHAISNRDLSYIEALQGEQSNSNASGRTTVASKTQLSADSSDSNPLQAQVDALLDRNAEVAEQQQFQSDLDYLDSLDQLHEAELPGVSQ